jgi:hypothetical protein
VHFPDSIDEEFSIPLSQHLAGRDDSLPMSLLAAGKLNFLIVRQFFAIVNIEEVAWHIKTVKRLEFFCNPRLASNPIADAGPLNRQRRLPTPALQKKRHWPSIASAIPVTTGREDI